MKRIFTISGLVLLCSFFFTYAYAQNITLKGKVTDATTGESLIGVSISVKGTTTGAQTDANGAFSLSASSNATLVVSYVGYTTQQFAVNGQTTINVKLQAQSNALNEVVVIGYGTQRKIDNTGAVATVKGGEIAKQASTNALSALQGKVAGVQIINSGQPGSSPTINIRGVGTVYGNVKPLFVVDGVWYDDISFLNNNDIENINVLKDASSTAIFGIRAANGVVIVTTKRGKTGTPTINYTGYVGWQSATNIPKMANGTEYAVAINELTTNLGTAIDPKTGGLLKAPYGYDGTAFGEGTNWYDQILRNGLVTNHQISMSGGTDKYTYNLSFGYLDQDGIEKTSNYKRYTVHLANDFKVVKNFKLGYNASIVSSNSRDIDGGIFHQLFAAAPIVPVYYSNGGYGDPADYNTGSANAANPQATIDFYNHKTKKNRLTGDAYAEYTFLKDFKIRTSFGGDIGQEEGRGFTPIYYATQAQQSSHTNLDITHINTRNWIWSNTLTYDKTIGKHKVTALLGYEALKNKTYEAEAKADSVPYTSNGSLHSSFPSTANPAIIIDPAQQIFTTQLSQFARVNYSYNDTYLLNASIRHDGASEFYTATKTPYGWFPSVGAGWVVSNEAFMKDQHVISKLKLRGSWGQVGSSVVPINPTQQTISNDPYLTAVFGNPQQYYQGASINKIFPPTILWEKGTATDFGIEAATLNNRLSIEAEYYNRKTQNAIFDLPILYSLGTTGTVLGNQADIVNKGFEFLVSWRDQINKDLSYSISANLGINDNKVTRVISGNYNDYGASGITNGATVTRVQQGLPIGEFYGYKVTGIFQSKADIANYKDKNGNVIQPNANPGDFKYLDVNGDGVISSKDKVAIGNPNAKYGYGINAAVTYKSFDLALDFQGVADVNVYNANIAYRYGNENFTQDFYDHRWHGAGTSNTYPSVNVGSTANSAPNSFFVSSGAYFRVRNAQLGYTLPNTTLHKLGVQKIRFFANAQNPVTIFGYKGFTPEIGGSVPTAGIDANVYPLYATYNFGVNVTF